MKMLTWILLWLLLALITISEFFMGGAPVVLVWFAAGWFGGAETLAVENDTGGDTFSEWMWKGVEFPLLRWAIAIWLVVLVGRTLGGWLSLGLAIWLPLHFALPGFERRLRR